MNEKKKTIIIVAVAIVAVIIIAILVAVLGKEKTKTLSVDLTGAEQVKSFISKVYEGVGSEMPALDTSDIDLNDDSSLSYFTGLTNKDDIEFGVVSEPLMTSQAYSLVFVRVKDESKVNDIKQQILDNVNYRKWICVSAEKTYVTNYGNTVILLMSSQERADLVYESIDKLLGNDLGPKIEKNNEDTAF